MLLPVALAARAAAPRQPARPPVGPQGGWMARTLPALGTRVAVELWADDRARGAAAMAAVLAEAQRIDRQFSAQRPDSETALLNRLAGGQAVRVSDEAFQLLARARELGQAGVLQVVNGADDDAPWRHLQLDAAGPCAALDEAGLSVDMSPLLAGHALNRGVALLRRLGVRHARVAAGGLCAWLGDRRGQPWPGPAIHSPALPRLQDLALALPEPGAGEARHAWVAASDALVAHAWLQALTAPAGRATRHSPEAWPGVLAWGFAEPGAAAATYHAA